MSIEGIDGEPEFEENHEPSAGEKPVPLSYLLSGDNYEDRYEEGWSPNERPANSVSAETYGEPQAGITTAATHHQDEVDTAPPLVAITRSQEPSDDLRTRRPDRRERERKAQHQPGNRRRCRQQVSRG
jgi:hypothetical protein